LGQPLPEPEQFCPPMEEVLAVERHPRRNLIVRVVAPVLAAVVAGSAAGLIVETRKADAERARSEALYADWAKRAVDCEDFDDSMLKLPSGDEFGIPKPGLSLPSQELSLSPSAVNIGTYLSPNGTRQALKTETIGAITDKDGKLSGGFTMPKPYTEALTGTLADSEIDRWGVCRLTGGLSITLTNVSDYNNGDFQPPAQDQGGNGGIEFILATGSQGSLYENQRSMEYVTTHEIGHSIRNGILTTGTDQNAIKLIGELDNLYAQNLKLGLEDYRVTHGEELINKLQNFLQKFDALDDKTARPLMKQQLGAAINYMVQKINQPNGLTDLALAPPDDSPNPEASLLTFDDMIARASLAVSPNNALYGLGEFFQDNPNALDPNLLIQNDKDLDHFLRTVFAQETVMSGDTGGHPFDNSDELFASLFTLTGYVSPDNYDRIVAAIPPAYRSVVRQQLTVMDKLRQTFDPLTLFSGDKDQQSPLS